MNDIFLEFPNWVDGMGTVVVVTFLMACEGLVILVCGWVLLKVVLLMYENLRQHVGRLGI